MIRADWLSVNRKSACWMIATFALLASGCTASKSSKDAASNEPKTVDSATDAPNLPPRSADQTGIQLTDVTSQSGISFVHHYNGAGNMYIVEPVASGLATLDFDCDGLQDLYFLNGGDIPPGADGAKPNELYRNVGHLKFQHASHACSMLEHGFSIGVVTGDYDNDGFVDIFVNNFGKNQLLRNNGDGTFQDTTDVAGVGAGNQLGAGACLLDADGDGLLDLYVGNYVRSPVAQNVKRTTEGFPSYPGPLDFAGDSDLFYRNNGDGGFSDLSVASGIAELATTSMGVISTDYDSDGDPDIIVVNDVERNLLLENDGQGRFEDVGVLRGIAYSYDAQRNGNMGVDCGDFDNDGSLDLFTTTFSNDLPVLYQQDGQGSFADVTLASGAGEDLVPHANWGTAFLDVDNDGWKDLFIANGHTDPNVDKWAFNTAWKVRNAFFRNLKGRRFQNLSGECGSGLQVKESSRGVVAEDFDGDGDIDLVVLNALAAPTVLKNETEAGHWLKLSLVGITDARDGTGARVQVTLGEQVLVAEVHSGRSYQSSYGKTLHFGLGQHTQVDSIKVRWLHGQTTTLQNLPANQHLIIRQGS